ncbi:hypothetical protein E3P92_03380 [Wallemia ichthyophaga]|uniref:Peptidase M20 dimerisation domain-containing protein n=2 Tax=Wallemia ichthyophaga TaxID=245174 RepID=A0A4T0JPD7_WALIC|nr:Cytosolic non-specific dipeptidase [Wallemia ichthyophaga EXF-994]TIA69838.1 hypothetical protein E3P91_03419 [Wallemia ichthyophaga]EOR03704.1 Cytosolic non-specific dipeptidase [Wallemia ichthyophaga EXF-994]TIA79346.1 hypothetical protein E3P98_03371 [Wallemia ichthyophaga]TIA89168.1 hypothetical protein E3P97_03207 [Wallemia ichthyophaga]TIB05311.1 hypothetical protein E3P96_01204 [Wallemia ichthyophaga]
MSAVSEYIEQHQQEFISRLREAVEIASVSGEIERRPQVIKMGHWLKAQLEGLGGHVRMIDIGTQQLEGHTVALPPVILAQVGRDASKKTITIYGHYDVQPAELSDGWHSDPFQLTVEGDVMRGRGSTDDKGPVVGWLNTLSAYTHTNTPLPVNLKFVFEGMEESGSEGLDELVVKESTGFLKDTDAVCISDNYWLTNRKPALTYGLRGVSYFEICVKGPRADLHSGVFGGTVHEPMTDVVKLMSTLVDTDGKITIPGLNEMVEPLSKEELKRYEDMDFDVKEYQDTIADHPITISDDKAKVLMGRMRYPSLSLHGIEGAFSGSGAKTVIPCGVKGKFSIRLVPNMDVDKVEKLVQKHLQSEQKKLNTRNVVEVVQLSGGPAWVADPNHWNFLAAAKAIKTVFGVEPDRTREGGSIPVTLTFDESLKVNVCLLPMGRADDGAHSTNEKLNISNYIQGSKVFAEYLENIAMHD